MPNVLIRDLPDDIHASLQRRARAAGQSLQQYVSGELFRLATTESMHEVLERIAARSGGTIGFSEAVADLDADRAMR